MTLHFHVVYVCGRFLTMCASFHMHRHTLEDLKSAYFDRCHPNVSVLTTAGDEARETAREKRRGS